MDGVPLHEQFRRHAAQNQWRTRQKRGLPRRMDVLDFVRDVYGSWIEKGAVRRDLAAVDEYLEGAIQRRKKPWPSDIKMRRGVRPVMTVVSTEEELAELLESRENHRAWQRAYVARQRAVPAPAQG